MSARPRSGLTHRRSLREIVVAVAVALAILGGTALVVWVLAPSTGTDAPTAPITSPTGTLPDVTTTTAASTPGG